MAQSLAKILVHTVFSTKDCRPFLRDKPLREELHRYLGGILAKNDCQPLIIGGIEDHVHLLSTLSRTCEAAEMVKEVKRGSSLWLKTKGPDLNDFAWQNGYGIFSIGFSQVETAKKYIAGQEEHHRKVSFQDEFRELLRRYEIEFDERYVWVDATLSELCESRLATQGCEERATLGNCPPNSINSERVESLALGRHDSPNRNPCKNSNERRLWDRCNSFRVVGTMIDYPG